MPGFPIIDTHVHLTDIDRLGYEGLRAEAPALYKSFDLQRFHEASSAVDLEAFLFMEVCVDTPYRAREAGWVTELAAEDSRLQGMIVSAAIESGTAVESELEAYAANPLVKGVRRLLQSEADDFGARSGFIEGLRCLPKHQLSFDICIAERQLPAVIEMVRACPDVSFMLDHVAKPRIKEGEIEPWRSHIVTLAEMPNVVCKVSGMVTEADHESWTRDDLRPYFDHIFETFGFDRVAFGGDWFVSELATTYPEWIATVDWATEGCSDDERRKLYCENARAFYRLESGGRS